MNIRRLAGVAAALVLAAWICGTAAAQETGINEIGTVAANETVTIGGTTNLAPGNRLLVTVTPIEIDTTGFRPGEYAVTVDWVEGDATASTTFTVTEAAAATPTATATPSTTATTPPATTATASPTPTAAGSALPVAAAFAAGLAGYLVRRR